MKSLLAKNAEVLVTMDDKRRELKNAGLYAVDGAIKQVGPTEELPKTVVRHGFETPGCACSGGQG